MRSPTARRTVTRARRRTAASTASPRASAAAPGAAPLPLVYSAQLARLVDAPPAGDEWLHEIKYDGYRIGCRVDGTDVRLVSRNGKDWTDRFPEIRDAALGLGIRRALLDGEITIVVADGRTSFQALQNAFAGQGSRGGLVYFAFDLLHLDGADVAARPLEERKSALARLLAASHAPRRRTPAPTVIRFADHVIGGGPAFFSEVCRHGLEGVVSKRRDLPYEPGRHGGWLKTKCVRRQEFVVGGFTDPEGTRAGIGALLVGVYDDAHRLTFAGKVGTGFTQQSALALRRRLNALETRASPFTPPPAGWLGRGAHWVRPELVAEVAFTEWTDEGKIRHPSFQGLRADKAPGEIEREEPERKAPSTAAVGARAAAARGAAATPKRGTRRDTSPVRLSHPDRVLYPEDGITKSDVAGYYEAVGDWIVPHVRGRPLTLVRCPDGVGSCFFMKHSRVWSPPGLRRLRIQEKTKLGEYLVADDLAGVLALVQMDVLEIHTWNTVAENVDRPNRIVLDLDPGPDVPWSAVVTGARLVRGVFTALGVDSFVKTTGGVGLHVVVPLKPLLDWRACLEISRAIADAIVRADPRTYTTSLPKAGRERKILIDYLRNNRTNTSVAAFSTRARRCAPVSVPLAWDELEPRLRPERFNVRTVPGRVRRLRTDPWERYWRAEQRLPKNALAALAAL